MELRDKINQRIQELENERDQFITNVNQQIAGYNVAINELKSLVEPPQQEG